MPQVNGYNKRVSKYYPENGIMFNPAYGVVTCRKFLKLERRKQQKKIGLQLIIKKVRGKIALFQRDNILL